MNVHARHHQAHVDERRPKEPVEPGPPVLVEGEYDDNDPANTPRLVHSLLFRVEERILSGLDSLAESLDKRLPLPNSGTKIDILAADHVFGISDTVKKFVSLIADNDEHSTEVWIGAFLEIVPRLELVGSAQLSDLRQKGRMWLEEHGCNEEDVN